jgi:outer membrane protein assembly factor BamB
MRIALLLVLAATAAGADWPQYRGPTRDDISPETGLLKTWPKDGPKLLWTFADAGVGYSPPAVVGDRLYLTGGRGDREVLFALDLKAVADGTVKELWAVELGPTFRFKGNSWSAGPSATPTVDGNLVFALGGNGDLVCVDTAGKEQWRANLPKDLGGAVNPIGGGPRDLGWGFTGSPLVDGDKLVLIPGGSKGTVAALDKKTGKVLWRSTGLTDRAAYTTPMPMEVGGVKQYVVLTNETLAGVAAADGKVLWAHKRKQPYGTEVINTPLVHDGHIYTTVAAGNGGCELVKVVRDGAEFGVGLVYDNKNLMNHHGNVVRVGDHVYGFGQGAGWACQEFKTGKIVWSERRALRAGAVTFADGRLYCLAEDDGTVALAEATPKEWTEAGRFKLPKASNLRQPQGKIWTPPVIAGGRLFLRDQDLLFCYDIRAGAGTGAAPAPKGRRVFTAGHSFHVFVPSLLTELARSAEIAGHAQVGVQSLGGSRVIQHWDLADDKDRVKPALRDGKVDVLTLSPIFHPDDGIDKLVELALKHNPDVRVTVQALWLPFDVYDRDYQRKRPAPVDRNGRTADEIRKTHAPYFASVDEQVRAINDRHGKPVVSVVPAGQAAVTLREKIIAGTAPGLKAQDDLFTDAIGHPKPALQALTAYCHFAVIYKTSPVGLPVPSVLTKGADPETGEKLNRLLQELAWEAVTAHPLSGVKKN